MKDMGKGIAVAITAITAGCVAIFLDKPVVMVAPCIVAYFIYLFDA